MAEYVVGIAVVIVIIVVAVVLSKTLMPEKMALPTAGADTTSAAVRSGIPPPASEASSWTRDESTSYVWGQVEPGKPSADGNAKFLGITGSAAECEDSCGKTPWCAGYTWNDASTASHSKTCYGVSNIRMKVADQGRYSGERVCDDSGDDSTHASTLSRRASMQSAGKETFGASASTTFGAFDKPVQRFVPAPSVGAALAGTFDAYKQNYIPAPSVGAALAGTFDAYKQNFVPAASVGAALAGTFDAYKQNFVPAARNLAAKTIAGMSGAVDAYKQNMVSPDPAFGTMWAGQHKTAALPI